MYPDEAGWKTTGTSHDAAQSVDATLLRERVRTVLACEPLTADEVADILGESVLSIRPRCSELRRLGVIFDSMARRRNRSGKFAIVWMLTKER